MVHRILDAQNVSIDLFVVARWQVSGPTPFVDGNAPSAGNRKNKKTLEQKKT
jgi:hypothetical protein